METAIDPRKAHNAYLDAKRALGRLEHALVLLDTGHPDAGHYLRLVRADLAKGIKRLGQQV